MRASDITDREFSQFQQLLYDYTGISLTDAKKPLVTGRLSKRLREHGLFSFSDYLKLIGSEQHKAEFQIAIDLLTTNETYFFREPSHFKLLREIAETSRVKHSDSFRVWSAASSSGQEAYSMAMVLADCFNTARQWQVVASDISSRVLDKARQGLYPIEQAEQIPKEYLTQYCLKGIGSMEGQFIIDSQLRDKVSFQQVNLNQTLPDIGQFDVIFLRNVMIYFELDTKRQVVSRISNLLKPRGYLVIGHSESLQGVSSAFKMLRPSVFQLL